MCKPSLTKNQLLGSTNYQQLPVPAPELPFHWTCRGSLHTCWDACSGVGGDIFLRLYTEKNIYSPMLEAVHCHQIICPFL